MSHEKADEKRAEKIIEAKETNLNKLFSSDFKYKIPFYQRPFSWGETQFDLLIDSILESMNNVEGHFLGAILLQEKSPGKYDLVDGQQRITALAILMAVIRDNTDSGDIQQEMQKCIYQEENKLRRLHESMRIQPWEKTESLFRKYIFTSHGTEQYIEDFNTGKIDYNNDVESPEFHLYEAIKTFREKLPKEPNELWNFVYHMLNDVYMVYMITKSDLNSAFRLFHTLNTAGLDLSPSDILKAENLGVIEGDKMQRQYADIWQSIEDELGRSALSDIVSFIRTIKKKEKAKFGIYQEYQEIFASGSLERGSKFIDYVKEIAQIYREKVVDPNIKGSDSKGNSKYKATVNLMNRFILFTDWIPPLIAFYYKFRLDDQMASFLSRLEKKIIVEWVANFSETERLTSIGRLIKTIEEEATPGAVLGKMLTQKSPETTKVRVIDFSNDTASKELLLKALNDKRFYFLHSGKLARYLLLRTDMRMWELENFSGYPGTVTVEHILPQTPDINGEWVSLFTKEERDEWTNRIGNLVLLSRRKNSRAQNYDFLRKKDIYFKESSTYFRITREIEDIPKWTLKELKERDSSLVDRVLSIYCQ